MEHEPIFWRYLIEIAIIIPEAAYMFLPLVDYFRRMSLKARVIPGVVIPVFVIMAAKLCSSETIHMNTALAVSYMFLFTVLFLSVNATPGRKLFCFFNAIMLGAFCRLYSLLLMVSYERGNVLWKSVRLLNIEAGLMSLGLALFVGLVFLKMLTEELPALLREEYVKEIWDFLFLLPLGTAILLWWMTPVYPTLVLIARARVMFLAILPFIPLVILVIYYLLWWVTSKLSESTRLQQQNTLLAMESKRHEELRLYMDDTRAMRHDFRQHILVITQLAESGNNGELLSYLHQFRESADKHYTGYCGNIAVDAVASYYSSCAQRQDTLIEWHLNIPQELPLKEFEYCAILGNLLENAMRAVKELPQGHRHITVISSLISPAIMGLSVDNPYRGRINIGDDGLPETVREGHGIGLMSVMNTVRRYGGSLNIKADNGIFSADIILYCNS